MNTSNQTSQVYRTKGSQFAGDVGIGKAIEVTQVAGARFRGSRLAIDSKVYERHVAWSSRAMREHLVYFEEGNRLEGLITAATKAGQSEASTMFAHTSVDAGGDSSEPSRQSFLLQRFDDAGRPSWLITQ